jgi:hypothetical protein
LSFRSFRLFAFLFFVLPGRVPAADQELSPDQIASHKDQEEILQEADSIFAEVSRLSGLAIKSPVAKKFENKAFFRDYYTRQLEQQYPPAKKAAYEKAYMILGFLPPGGDIIRSYLDSFLKVVQGLYDPKTKTLYLADWIDWQDQENTLAHELTHALQDQHFDLTGFLAQGEGLSMDEQFARSSIMEGQAVAIALNLSLEDRGTDFTRVVNIAEWVGLNNYLSASGQKAFGHRVFLNEAINFPYVQGATFLQNYVRAYGWKGMEALFRHPPRSTRQILHPSEFFPKRHNPIRIQLGDLSAGPLPGYTRIWEDSFGEYGLTTLLAQEVGEKEAQRAAAGWRGDRFQVYEKRPSPARMRPRDSSASAGIS